MIAFIKGTVDSLSEGKMILESHGIGYELNIPASMFDAGIREGEELKIYTHMSVREDGISLFGFLSREDLEIYRMLIGVSGIGPKAALAVLSTLTADNLRFAVLSEDVQAIAKTPGIGKKTAQKLILELKDKFDSSVFFTLASQWPHIMPSIVMVFTIPCSVVMFRSSFRISFLILLSFDASCIRNRFRRRAFVTTQKLERLIAAAPNIGFSFQPNSGIHTPAASGIPMIL